MFDTNKKLQYAFRAENSHPAFARALQQTIGGVEGEVRVAMQYFFQARGARGKPKFRDFSDEYRHGKTGPHRDARHCGCA